MNWIAPQSPIPSVLSNHCLHLPLTANIQVSRLLTPLKTLTLKTGTTLFAQVLENLHHSVQLNSESQSYTLISSCKDLCTDATIHSYGYPCTVVCYGFDETSLNRWDKAPWWASYCGVTSLMKEMLTLIHTEVLNIQIFLLDLPCTGWHPPLRAL